MLNQTSVNVAAHVPRLCRWLLLAAWAAAGCAGAAGNGGISGDPGRGGTGGLGQGGGPTGGAPAGGQAGGSPVNAGGTSGTSGASGGASGGGGALDAASGDETAPVAPTLDASPAPGPVGDDLPGCGRTVMVADSAQLTEAVGAVTPGDCLVLGDGVYSAPVLAMKKGTAQAPIVLRAAHRGAASFSGDVTVSGSSYVVVEGFVFPGATGISFVDSDHCRITRSKFLDGPADVHGSSSFCRIDHNEFGPKNSNGNMARPTGLSTNTRIDHNHFHDVSPAGGNGRETIRLGCCGAMFDYHDQFNVVEYNLLISCSGEAEMISVKSSSNIVRYNTIRRSSGTLTLRAGRKNEVYGNYVFGEGKQGGLRIYEDDHKIYNNYFETGSALSANGGGGGHAPVRRLLVVHNTFVGNVSLSGEGNVVANNIVIGALSAGGATAQANLVTGAAAGAGLTRMGDVLSIGAMGPARAAAMGSYPFVSDDIHGQPRAGKADLGAEEWAADPAPGRRRPLTPADVGPDSP